MKRGFTLAEMLIALALTAVAITIMSEGVRHTMDFQRQLKAVREDRETLSATLEAIRARLEHLVPARHPPVAGAEAVILFHGQPRRLTFLSADPGYPSAAGVYEYTLELTGGDTDGGSAPLAPQLILTRRPLTDLGEFALPARGDSRSWTLPLSEPLTFGYAAPGGSFAANWQEMARYPALVSLVPEAASHAALTVALPRARTDQTAETPGRETAQ